MDLAKVQVSGIRARVAYCMGIPAGIVGAKVQFDYTDPLWDGLIKNVVFEGSKTVSIYIFHGIMSTGGRSQPMRNLFP